MGDVKGEESGKGCEKEGERSCFVEGEGLLIDLEEEGVVCCVDLLGDEGEGKKGLIGN